VAAAELILIMGLEAVCSIRVVKGATRCKLVNAKENIAVAYSGPVVDKTKPTS
jgi:hypothetical protein